MTKDLTNGRPVKVLLAFSIPMLIGNVFQQFYNLVDLAIVGRFVGLNALAAVGATGSLMFFLFSLVIGLTNGASVVISQYFGSGDSVKVRRAVAMTIYMLIIATIALTALGLLITKPMLRIMGTPDAILDTAALYLHIIFAGSAAMVAYNGVNSIARAFGNSVTPLVFLIVAVFLNVGLDILFVVPMGMGVAGAALATVVAQVVAAVGCIIYCVKTMPMLWLSKSDFKTIDKDILKQTMRLGIPGAIQNAFISIGNMAVQTVINSYGEIIMAAGAAAMKLDQLAVQPLMTIGMASATYTAQNIGAGKVERVRQGMRSIFAMSVGFSIAVAVAFHLFGSQLMTLFIEAGEWEVLKAGTEYLKIVSVFYCVVGVLIALQNMLRGAGDVIVPMISCAAEIVARFLAANILAHFFGYIGIWWASPMAWIAGAAICLWRYRTGAWVHKSLVSAPYPPPEKWWRKFPKSRWRFPAKRNEPKNKPGLRKGEPL